MLTAPLTLSASIVSSLQPDPVEQTTDETTANVAEPSNAVPAEPVNTVETSEMARKMKQAEKARNAKENDSFGGGITIIAMAIVVSALAALSILFLIFGKIFSALMSRKKRKAHGVEKHEAEKHHNEVDSGEVIAAISLALAEHLDGKGHDLDRTIMTLKRMKRAYSPWNSKIYNIRQIPTLHKN